MSTALGGILCGHFWQMAYVTNDFDQALAVFGEKTGVKKWFIGRDAQFMVGPGADASCHVAVAFAGGIQLEIIQPLGGTDHVYREPLKGDAFQLHYHHEAKRIDSLGQLAALKDEVRRQGFEIVIEGTNPLATYFYADTRPLLGHYTEFMFYPPEALAYFDKAVPVNP